MNNNSYKMISQLYCPKCQGKGDKQQIDYINYFICAFCGYKFSMKHYNHIMNQDKPAEGKQYALTGKTGSKCIANGNTWKESEVINL